MDATDTPKATGRWITPAVLLLFFLSGITGLVYQVLWMRMLALSFGHTVQAVTTVLFAFMAGLALGSRFFGPVADRGGHPLALYARLQMFIGVYAAVTPFFLSRCEAALGPVYGWTGAGPVFTGFRFLVACLVLIPPATAMGGTMPALSRFVAKAGGSLSARIGLLYAVNTLGAVLGCFATGFWLIPMVGMRLTILEAAGLNIAVGLCALLLAPRAARARTGQAAESGEKAAAAGRTLSGWRRRVVVGCFCISGFTALALEVVWTRALVYGLFQGSSTYAFTAMLTVFLIGLGVGSLAAAPLVRRLPNALPVMAWSEIGIGLSAMVSLALLLALPAGYLGFSAETGKWLGGIASDFLRAGVVMLPPTLLMGAVFPMVVQLCVVDPGRSGAAVGRIYAGNTVGAIAGSLAAGFLLIPLLGLGRSLLALGSINLGMGIVLGLINEKSRPAWRYAPGAAGVVAAILVILLVPTRQALQPLAEGDRLLHYEEATGATVAVVENEHGDRGLVIDNVGVAGTSDTMQTDQKSLAHVPCLLHPDPRRILTVGFGSGGASWSFTTYPELEEIHCAEIEPAVVRTAEYFRKCNVDLFDDPRFQVVLDDARSYLLLSGERYDIISTDCTDLEYRSNAALYTLEYFRLCRDRLRENGLLVVWMPLKNLAREDFLTALRTFQAVFPEGTVWYLHNRATHYVLLVGFTTEPCVDWSLLRRRLAHPKVHTDLAAIDLADPYRLLSCCLLGPPELAELVSHARELNTEDRPVLEFRAPRNRDPAGDVRNLEAIVHRAAQAPLRIVGIPATEQASVEAAMARMQSARDHLLAGHLYARMREAGGARYAYRRALARLPDDEAIRALLEIGPEREAQLRQTLADNPADRWTRFSLALLLRDRGEREEAAALMEDALIAASSPAEQALLGTLLLDIGRLDEARARLQKAAGPADTEKANPGVQALLDLLDRVAAADRQPADSKLRFAVAEWFTRRGTPFYAVAYLERFAEEDAAAQLLDALGTLCSGVGLYQDALRHYSHLVRRFPADPHSRVALLDILVRLERSAAAEPHFQWLQQHVPGHPRALFCGARLRFLQGRMSEAGALLLAALKVGGPVALNAAQRDPLLQNSDLLKQTFKLLPGGPPSPPRRTARSLD